MNRIDVRADLSNCCGCGACMLVCPREAITMGQNALGVLYPQIDESLCVHCGKCTHVCTYHVPIEGNLPKAAFAAVGNNAQLIQNSASGGIFASMAEVFLHDGGMVAGAVLDCYDNNAEVYHILTNKASDINRIQGSKYVQSNAYKCFSAIQDALEEGRPVLFSGTPCQVAAVKQLTGNPEKLVTMDLICHGVPPQKMLNDYLDILGKRFGGIIEDLCFRDKSIGKDFTARFAVNTGACVRHYYLRSGQMSFYSMFLKGSIYRESCYDCPYAKLERISDITIGDYWGILNYHGKEIQSGLMPKQDHWSCVLVNTEKGQGFLRQYEDCLLLFQTNLLWVCEQNAQLNLPSKKTIDRDEILDTYKKNGYSQIEKQFIRKIGGVLRYFLRIWKLQYRIYNHKEFQK